MTDMLGREPQDSLCFLGLSSSSQPLYDDIRQPYPFGLSPRTLLLALHIHEPTNMLDGHNIRKKGTIPR